MEVIEKLLFDLQLATNTQDASVDPSLLIQNIEAQFLEEQQKEYCIALLLQSESPPSLLSFLSDNFRSKDRRIVKAKLYALKFLAVFIKQLQSQLINYAFLIFDSLLDLFKKVESNEIKAHIIFPMKNLFRQNIFLSALGPEDIKLDVTYKLLIDHYLNQKPSKGLRGELLKLLGLLVSSYPDDLPTISAIDKILDVCFYSLKNNFNSNNDPELPVIAGAFSCLDRCIFHFEERFVDNQIIWKYLLQSMLAVSQENIHRFIITSKALRLLKHHAGMFQTLIGMNPDVVYHAISLCYHSEKKVLQKHAESAIIVVLKEISNYTIQNPDSDSTYSLITSLKKEFSSYLDQPTTPENDIVLAVRGFAAMAPALSIIDSKLVVAADVKDNSVITVLHLLIASCRQIIGAMTGTSILQDGDDHTSPNNINVLKKKTEFLFACASILHTSNSINLPDDIMDYLCTTSVDLILGYSRLWTKYQPLIPRALCLLLQALRQNMVLFHQYTTIIIPCLILRTIGRRNMNEHVEVMPIDPLTGEQDTRLFPLHIPLWGEILTPEDKETKLIIIMSEPSYSTVVAVDVYDATLRNVVDSIKRLQLSYTTVDDEILPDNLVDQEMLLNMVSFLEKVLPKNLSIRLILWMPVMIEVLISMSFKYPLVSAFYRLINCLTSTVQKLDYFEETYQFNVQLPSGVLSRYQQERIVAINKIKSYLTDVSHKLDAFNNQELLSQALSLIINTTSSIVTIPILIDCIYVSLRSGLEVNISVRKLNQLSQSEVAPHLSTLLPLLRPFLSVFGTHSKNGDRSGQTPATVAAKLSSSMKAIGFSKSASKRKDKTVNKNESESSDETSSRDIAYNILRFLGSLGGLNKGILCDPVDTLKESPSLGKLEALTIAVPLPVISYVASGSALPVAASKDININVSGVLLRLISLCKHGEDKQLRILSAEILHYIIVMLVGKAAIGRSLRQSASKSDFAEIYSLLFPTAIHLAACGEAVTRRLFETLLWQIIHWFSGHGQVHSDDCDALLETLFAQLSDSSTASVRTLAAGGLQEFFQWSIKQAKKSDLTLLSSATGSLISRLLQSVIHPNSSKRHGAMAALCKLYRSFREETALINLFSLQILFRSCESLLLSDPLNPNQDCIDAAKHYSEIIFKSIVQYGDRAKLLSASTERTFFPRTLSDLLLWLWDQLAHPHTPFRRTCMQCFSVLCPAEKILRLSTTIDDASTVQIISEQVVYLLDTRNLSYLKSFEASLVDSPVVSLSTNHQSAWLSELSAALDCFSWLIRMKFLSPSKLLQEDSQYASNSSVSTKETTHGKSKGGSSETTSRKRKATTASQSAEEPSSENPVVADQSKQGKSPSLLLNYVREFFCYCNSLTERSVSSEQSNQLVAHQRVEVLRRVVQLCANILETSSSAELSGSVQAINTILSQKGMDILLHGLLTPSTGHGGLFTVVDTSVTNPNATHNMELEVYLPAAIEKLLELQYSAALKMKDKGVVSIECLRSRILQQLDMADKLDFLSLQCLHRAISIVKTSSYHDQVFAVSTSSSSVVGADAARLLQRANALFQLVFGISLSSEDIDDSRQKLLLDIALDIGLPVVSASEAAGVSGIGPRSVFDYIRTCTDRNIVDAFLCRYEEKIVVKIIEGGVSGFTKVGPALIKQTLLNESIFRIFVKLLATVDSDIDSDTDLISAIVSCCHDVEDAALLERSQVFELILALDARLNSAGSNVCLHKYALDSILSKLQDCNSPVESVIGNMSLLPYVLSGVTAGCPRPVTRFPVDAFEEQRVVTALEDMVADRFPLDSRRLDPTSKHGKVYSEIFRAYLDCIASCGSLCLFGPLLPSVREGRTHRYIDWMDATIARLQEHVRVDGEGEGEEEEHANPECASGSSEGVAMLCHYCIKMMLDKYQTVEVKSFFRELCLGVLANFTPESLVRFFTSSNNSVSFGTATATTSSSTSSAALVTRLLNVVSVSVTGTTKFSSSEDADSSLYMYSVAYDLLGVLFDRCFLASIKGPVTIASHGPSATGKELTQAICRAAHKQVRSDMSELPSANIIQRLYSSAYNCLLLVVAKTQSDEKFFDSFLFVEKSGETFWTHIIDCTQSYCFGIDNEKGFKTVFLGTGESQIKSTQSRVARYRGSSSRSQLTSRYLTSSSALVSQSSLNPLMSSQSMSSQHHQHHPLSQRVNDLESLELTFPSQKNALDSAVDTTKNDQAMAMEEGDVSAQSQSHQAVRGLDDHCIAVEMNDVNQQPCMGPLLRVLQRMAVLFSTAWENQAAVMDLMPKWLTECRDRLVSYSPQDTAARRVMRLFMLRLLINQPVVAIVTPWAQDLFLPVIECCNHDLCEMSGGSGYHYFLRDVVFTFCETWSHVRPKSHSEIEPSCRFLSNLIGLAYIEESSKLSENKRSIIALLRLWLSDSHKGDDLTPSLIRNYGRLDLSELTGFLGAAAGPTGGAHAKSTSRGTESVKQRLYSLDILETLLLNGYKLFTRGVSGLADRILELLIEGVKFPRKEVFERSASLSGLVLAVIARESAQPDLLVANAKEFRDKLESRLSSKIMQVDGLEGVAACLRAVAEHSPDFITRELLVKMLSVFSKLQAKGKIALLEVLYRMTSSRFDNISVVNSLRPFIISCLTDLSSVAFGRGVSAVRLPMVQINMLLLLTKHQEDLELPIIQLLLGKSAVEGLSLVTSTKSVQRTREVAYDLLMGLYHKNRYLKAAEGGYAETSAASASALTASLRKAICILLLKGLSDPDDAGIDDITSYSSTATAEMTSTASSTNSSLTGRTPGRIGIRRKVFDFFNTYIGLSADPGKRLLGLMTELFDVSQSGVWLHYGTYLLLCLPKETKDFRVPLFEHTLSSDTVFAPMKLVGDRLEDRPSNPMTPLFSLDRMSQLSQSQFSQHSGLASALSWGGTQSVDRSGPRGAMLRGTQQVHWTQTQEGAGGAGEGSPADGEEGRGNGWISEMSTQKAYRDQVATKTARLRFDGMPPPAKPPSRLSAHNTVIVQRVPVRYGSTAGAGATAGGSGYAATGKTFYQSSQQAQNRRDLAQARNVAKVVVYRQYRSGELPDISITPADLLLPLQRLCLLDSVIASTVFSSIFEGLYANHVTAAVTRSPASNDDDWRVQVQMALKQMLRDSLSVDCNSQFVSTILSSCQACVGSLSEPFGSQSGVESNSKKSLGNGERGIDSKLVAEVALQSLNFHSGIQLLEMSIVGNTKKIIKIQEKDNSKRKRQSAMITQGDQVELRRLLRENTSTLLQLIRLFSGLGEFDVLVGLVTRFNASKESRKALDCEQQGDFSKALKQYNILIQNLETPSGDMDALEDVDRVSREEEHWQEKSLECMRQLMHWEDLYAKCNSLSGHPEGVLGRLSDESMRGRLLPHFLKSICNLGDEGRDSDSTNECLTRLLQSEDTELKRWVEGRFAPDFACCFLYVEDWTKSKYFAEKTYDQFLSKWSSLHPCAYSARHQLLQGLQRVVEIEEWATLKRDNLDMSAAFQRWISSDPAKSDPIWMWNDVARVRQLILMSNNSAASSSSRSNTRTLQMLSSFHIKMAGAAVSQGSLDVVKPLLTISSSLRRQETSGGSGSSIITMDEVVVGYQYHRMKIKRTSASDSKKITEIFTNTLNLLNTKLTSTGKKEVEDLYRLYQMRAEWFGQWGELEYRTSGQRSKLMLAMEDYRTALSHVTTAGSVDRLTIGTSYGNLASYCDKLLELGCFPENEVSTISQMVIENYVKGIIHGDSFCRSKLLRLLRLAGEHPELFPYLEENLLSVPAWIYLKYSAQLMSCLDRPEGVLVVKVLEYVAMKYPEALYFPLTSTIECLGTSGKSLAKQKLERYLHNQNLDSFVEALTGLTHPEHRFVDGLRSLEGLLRGGKVSEAKAAYSNLRSCTLMNEWAHVGDKIGSYNSKWANKVRKEMDRDVGPNGEKLNQQKDYIRLLTRARELVSAIPHRNTAKVPLTEFSDWLSDTNFSKVRIEIPGQYSNFNEHCDSEPDVSQHVTIASVNGSLLVMSSIRKPKRITITGSNGKDLMFLVKGGEDLRNDERVETLFMMMNGICQPTGLRARTFTVIPMTPRVGILEWVSDTIPLKSVIGEEMERDVEFCAANPIPADSAGSHMDHLRVTEFRDEWLRANEDDSDMYEVFRNCKDASEVWRKMLQHSPDDFIRRYLLSLSTSAETFLTLRSEFAKSLAISNIFGYVLGLGDRHLENLLVDKKCGSIVQIDFGVCFGIGTSMLPLPEMIPFRLSPQLIGGLQPLDGIGLLRHYMVDCLLALRSDQGLALLGNALDIYVNDPILDWIKGHEYDKDEAATNAKHTATIEISRKVGNTLKKLRGVHPVQILTDDLKQNASLKKNKLVDAAINVLSISSEEYRVADREIVLDVSDQVDSLLYLATDPNILIRQYIGLRTWL